MKQKDLRGYPAIELSFVDGCVFTGTKALQGSLNTNTTSIIQKN